MTSFEKFAKDSKENKKPAKKSKMRFSDWEKRPDDSKHDKQKAIKGFKKGGITSADAKNMGRNLARVANQKSTGRGR